MTLNAFTEGALIWFLVGLIALELVTLVGRLLFGPSVKTISMILRNHRNHTTGVVFALSAMPTHWWVPTFPTYAAGTVVFWLLAIALFVWDLAWRNRPLETWPGWAKTLKDSRLWVAAGMLAGLTLFPQAA